MEHRRHRQRPPTRFERPEEQSALASGRWILSMVAQNDFTDFTDTHARSERGWH